MRKLTFLSVLLVMILILMGCAQISRGRTEIDKLFITRIISFDEADDGKVMVTLTTKSLSMGGSGQQQENSENIVSEGVTLSDANKNLVLHTDKRPSFGHTEYILFGEAIARKGIRQYLDFISRNNEFRYNAKIYIVKGETANTLVKKTNTEKLFVGDRISRSEENSSLTSLSGMITLNEALLVLDTQTLDLFIPSIEMSSAGATGDISRYDVLISGYSLLVGDKLTYFTTPQEARGINWMMNRIGSGTIMVENKAGEKVSLIITNGKTKIKPEINGNELHCTVEATFTSSISEIMGVKTTIEKESIDELISLQNKAIQKEIEHTISRAQELNSDHFSMFSKFVIKYPMLKKYFTENWKQLFPNIRFEVRVKSKIKGTFLINEPSGHTEIIKGH